MDNIPHLLEIAKIAALDAGKSIMEIYASGDFEVDLKEDNSPLTRADIAAHTIIANQLQTTGLPLLSEEGRNIPWSERKSWDYFWLIDPLDGTKEFIKRNGEFTVNIALMKGNAPAAGVIYAPCQKILYFGSKDTGVFKTEKNRQIQLQVAPTKISVEELLQRPHVTVIVSKSHLNEATKMFIDQFTNVQLCSMGSSFKLMLLAEGKADIYPRLAPTMEWDIAAGHALLLALNKGVYKEDLQSQLLYNKEDLLNPSFIAC